MSAQGQKLREYLDKQGIKYLVAADRLEIHVNTLRNWMEQETFKQEVLDLLASTFPSIIKEYPEVQFLRLNITQFKKANMPELQPENLQDSYLQLLHKYNQLLEQHVGLQEQLLEIKE